MSPKMKIIVVIEVGLKISWNTIKENAIKEVEAMKDDITQH